MNTQQLTSFNVLLIGDDCSDVYQYGTVDRISPEAPVPVFKYSHKDERGGMARNVKANLEELGCRVDYLSGETSVKTRLIDIRSKQQIVRIDNDNQSQPLLFPDIEYSLDEYDAIVISDYNKGYVSYDLIRILTEEFNGPIFVDTKKTDLLQLETCIIKINDSEYSKITSFPSEYTDVIVTRGAEGATWKNKIFPANKVEVADVCGAGDTFLAALCYWHLNSHGDMAQAIEFAIQASAVTVQHLGVYAPSLKEIT
jgi:D-beta-D-heptose 7-phosphate kinase/D-beta-D-heptose 1-phosphate adenosyltransferase